MKEGQVNKPVEIDETLCKGCGSCMATCSKQGIIVAGFSMAELEAQGEAALGLINPNRGDLRLAKFLYNSKSGCSRVEPMIMFDLLMFIMKFDDNELFLCLPNNPGHNAGRCLRGIHRNACRRMAP
jgi:ferredoxin